MILIILLIFNQTSNSLSELFTLHRNVISRFTLLWSQVTVGNYVGVFGNGDGCLLYVTRYHSDNDAGLLALVYGFWNAFFQWVLDTGQT